jgi:hypothetical protein
VANTSNSSVLPASAVSCVFSCYLVTIARVSCLAQSQSTMRRVSTWLSTVQLIEEFAKHDGDTEEKAAASSGGPSRTASGEDSSAAVAALAGSGETAVGAGSSLESPRAHRSNSKTDSSPSQNLKNSRSFSMSSKRGTRRRSESDQFDVRALAGSAKMAIKVQLAGFMVNISCCTH